jgi:hypothetical protein
MPEPTRIPFVRPYFPRAALRSDNLEFWVGREAQTDRLVRGLLAATEAHYLLTGYPGVGKTSFVSRVVAEWRRMCALQGIDRILIFNLQLAQSQSPEEVVRRLIGKVYFGSLDGQFSPEERLSERLQLNFIQSHSKTLKETQDETTTKDKGGEATINLPKMSSVFGGGAKISLGKAKQSRRSLEIEREYNLSAVITDFEAVIHLLTKPESYRKKRWLWLWRLLGIREDSGKPRILFVFDQIDDLDSVQDLAPLFSLPYASFIVLAGIKLKEQITEAKEKGIHVLDNFQEEYLACEWNQADKILSLLISEDDMGARRFAEYRDYLNFSAQGLPRRLFSAIDQHTSLVGDQFFLQLNTSEFVRARLGARLHRVIWKNRKRILGEYIDNVQHYRRDRALRGVYHLADRMFRTARFTFHEASVVATQMSDAIIHNERQRVLNNLLSVCVAEGLIDQNGNDYGLSEEILRWVRKIPDWLKDGFADAHEFFTDFTGYGQPGLDQTGVVQLTEPISSSKREVVPVVEREEKVPEYLLEHLTKYRIVKLLGSGGMGSVYLAEDTRLARRVALKVIRSEIARSPGIGPRFLREGRLIAQLHHPNIVQIFDIEELPTGQIVLVTEFVEGGSLEHLMTRGRLSVDESLRITIEIAKALGEAHSKDIVHRDIKPSNVLVTNSGHVKLLDFGVAKLADYSSTSTSLTMAGAMVGTPRYMPPEQIKAEPVDGRADLFSLGMVAYEMLTGRLDSEGKSLPQMIHKILSEQAQPPSNYNPSIPPELDQIILKCLEKDPKDRFANATDLIEALENVRKKSVDAPQLRGSEELPDEGLSTLG